MGDLFEGWEKPEWDEYFMGLALCAAMRSIDPSQKNGCVIVDDKNRILSIGYNGPPRGTDDKRVPLTRPRKYLFMEHAEKNAIINRQLSIEGATLYVTSVPCINCLRSVIQSGVKRVVHGPFKSRHISEDDTEAMEVMVNNRKDFIVEEFKGDMLKCLKMGIEYFDTKLDSMND